jgi:hypothetical protein
MTDTRTKTSDVIPLFGRARIENDPEIRNRRAVISVRPPAAAPTPAVADLTGKPKALFLVGLGGTGKTMLARWVGWRMAEQGRAALIAALDPQNRTLADWFTGVVEPETSDMHHTARWARDVLDP